MEERDPKNTRVLLVGAGATGQVYGYHLAEAGAEVHYVVKPKYLQGASRGYRLYRHRLIRRAEPIDFHPAGLHADLDEVRGQRWDQLWLCVSSPALRGDWLADLIEAAAPDTLVMLQPALSDRAVVARHFPDERIVAGMTGYIAYDAPLRGESFERPGIAYWLPPGSPTAFDGQVLRAKWAATLLDAGGCPAVFRRDTAELAAFLSCAMVPAIAALELAGWSLDDYRKGEAIGLGAAASRQAMAAAAERLGEWVPLTVRPLARTLVLRPGLVVADTIMPFDLERYLAFHFAKVGEQTRQMLGEYAETARQHDLPADQIEALIAALDAVR